VPRWPLPTRAFSLPSSRLTPDDCSELLLNPRGSVVGFWVNFVTATFRSNWGYDVSQFRSGAVKIEAKDCLKATKLNARFDPTSLTSTQLSLSRSLPPLSLRGGVPVTSPS